jgi:hypothetical protein
MLETNIRIVHPGPQLYVRTRLARVESAHLTPDLLQRACGVLKRRHGLAAVPAPGDRGALLVATDRTVPPVHLAEEEWELEVWDAGTPTEAVKLTDLNSAEVLSQLIERALQVQVASRTDLWTLDSPRIWYEARPFREQQGIAAYRRYRTAALPIDDVGVGVAVDAATAFFAIENLAYFFDPNVSAAERRRRSDQFDALTGRPGGQKGTLLYDNGRSRVKCYFESSAPDLTCGTTGRIRVKGQSYESLLAYYQAEYPDLLVGDDTPVVRVSFPGISRPQFVAADRVWVRVMNDDVPEPLSSIDKISPAERRQLICDFWQRLSPRPLGSVAPGMCPGFWQPEADRAVYFTPPALIFGQGDRLKPPAARTTDAYREHYRQRAQRLEKAGCYSLPPSMTRTLHCAYPESLAQEAPRQLANRVTEAISAWSGHRVSVNLVGYSRIADAVSQLRAAEQAGVVLFVLNDEPAAYHEAAFQLADWRVKRITERTLREHYDMLVNGVRDRRTGSRDRGKGGRRWRDFVTVNALEIVQLLDGVPFFSEAMGPYEAHLIIDVGHDRKYFALSLLISRGASKSPSFCLVTRVEPKVDHQYETINAIMLRDQIVDLVQATLRRSSAPIRSLLVLRDGHLPRTEADGIDQAVAELVRQGKLTPDVRIDLAELHKDTLKSLRLWDTYPDGTVNNPLEGTAVILNGSTVVITTTGATPPMPRSWARN